MSKMMNELNRKTVKDLPRYTEKILQFGEGNFLRAFVDWMIWKMNREVDFDAGVTVVQPIERGMVDMLQKQDGLYHLYLQGIENGESLSQSMLIDCIQKAVNPYSEYEAYRESIVNPSLRFVTSNTTEAGIAFDPNDTLEMKPQRSFPGKVASLLHERFSHFKGDKKKGLIFLCCELIDQNADVLKKYVLEYAEQWKLGNEFKEWINEACAFCSTLVDRIVPGFPNDRIDEIQQELGYQDNLVVMGEYFHVWVIEAPAWVRDEFPAEKAGLHVIFTDDMTNYRERKVRVLNGAHTSTFAAAFLSGIDTVREATQDEVVGAFLEEVVYEEICPNIQMPQDEVKAFASDILERFYNPYIKHLWSSIALNSMSKWETRVQPSLLDYVERTGQLPKRIVFSLAAMMAYYKGECCGKSYEVVDNQDILDLYKEAWSLYDGSNESLKASVQMVLAYKTNFKRDLNEIPGLTNLVSHFLQQILDKGMKPALQDMMKA